MDLLVLAAQIRAAIQVDHLPCDESSAGPGQPQYGLADFVRLTASTDQRRVRRMMQWRARRSFSKRVHHAG